MSAFRQLCHLSLLPFGSYATLLSGMTDVALPVSSGRSVDGGGTVPPDVYRRRWLILGVLNLSLLIVVIANTSLNVALPTMSSELGLSNSAQQWVVDAYSLVFAGLLFTAGSLGDRWGRKRFLQAGILLFGVASLYGTLFVDSGASLIITRAVMGIGGALVMPATLSILVNTFPAGERARAIAIWSGVAGGGSALGIVLGGWLVENFWWGATFAINVPVAIIALVLGLRILPESRESHPGRIDLVGAALSISGLVLLVYGLIEGAHWGWTDPKTLATVGGGVVVLALFALWELHTSHPMLEVRLFKNRVFTASSLGITLVFLTMFGFFFVISQLFQLVLGYGPFESGLRMLPITIFFMVFTPMSARAVAAFGVRRVVIPGMVATAAGILVISFLNADSSYLHVVAGMAVMSLGMSFTMTPLTTLIMASVPPEHAGMGSAMNDTTPRTGHDARSRGARQPPVVRLRQPLRQHRRAAARGRSPHRRVVAGRRPRGVRAGRRLAGRGDLQCRQGRLGTRPAAVDDGRRGDHPRGRTAHVAPAPPRHVDPGRQLGVRP